MSGGKTKEQLKLEKKIYDKEYRRKNSDKLKKSKADYFKKDYSLNPEKYRKVRQKRYQYHLEYLRKPICVEKKKVYDKKRRAKIEFGEFWECAILINEIEVEIPNREVKSQNGLINKKQKRRRDYEKTEC